MAVARGPLGYEERSENRTSGKRSVGQYFDLDFCVFLVLILYERHGEGRDYDDT